MVSKSNSIANIENISEFDEIIDVRTPDEFALDHLPGAVNYPVLRNEERIIVGTMYKQVSAFEAKKLGATLIARNIANHIEHTFSSRPKNWKPLIYCWRGGKRSGSMGHILRQIGWDARVLHGGYKSYRASVLEDLKTRPSAFKFVVITGRTGSAKSRVLETLAQLGNQVLDLEGLANHKGSVLGGNLESPQPSQKYFETCINQVLKGLSIDEPVFIEAESRKVGSLQVPDTLLEKIRSSPCIRINASISARVAFLQRDYAYMISNPDKLFEKLTHLKSLVGLAQLNEWQNMISNHQWPQLVESLLEKHYDRLYEQSQERNYSLYQDAPEIHTDDLLESGILQIATRIGKQF
jgi:tRNA 2-selenouridine synthase